MEVLVVVLIIGLIAAIAIPSFRLARRKVQDMLIANNLKQIWNAAQLYFLESGATEVLIEDLVWYTKPDGSLKETAENPYTNVIKCIRGEDYDSLFSITQEYVVVRNRILSSEFLYADGKESLYDQGLILSDTFILATPFEENAEWIGIEVESGNFVSSPTIRQALDTIWQEIFAWTLENDPLNAWQYFDETIWEDLYDDFLENKWKLSSSSLRDNYFQVFVGNNNSTVSHFQGILYHLFYDLIGQAPLGENEDEYNQLKQDLDTAIADVKSRISRGDITDSGSGPPISFEDYKLAYALRERIYALGVKVKGIDFINTPVWKSGYPGDYLNEIYGPAKTVLENLL
jgi:type II secretory pathway pseudopilin PulG